jgi:hypothetical protein
MLKITSPITIARTLELDGNVKRLSTRLVLCNKRNIMLGIIPNYLQGAALILQATIERKRAI